MPPVATCPDLSRYQQLAAGSLAEADEVALLAHLEHCEACARKLNGLHEPDALASLLRQARTSHNEAEQGRVARLIARLSKLRPGDTSAVQRDETQTPDTTLPCPSCGKPIKVRPEWAGKQVQ